MMRRRILVIAATMAAAMLLLTACTSSENEEMKEAGAGASGSSAEGTGSLEDDADSQAADAESGDGAAGTGESTQSGQTVSGVTVEGGTDSASSAAGGNDSQSSADAAAGQSSSDDTVQGEFDGVYQEGADEGEAELTTGDIWTGVYGNDQETVTLTYIDASTIYFTFSVAGIYGNAEVSGYQAVYKGDDYHVVVFNIQDNTLEVSVSSEEDYDASGSPLIGTYIRDYVSTGEEDVAETETNA